MNLYLRFFIMIITSLFKKKTSILDTCRTQHRVWPNDCDIFGHMNNGRYFAVTDLVRSEMLIRAGILSTLRSQKIFPVMTGETIQFRKSLLPLQKYEIISRMSGWDDRDFYIEHQFMAGGELRALVLVRIRVVGNNGIRVTPVDILRSVESNEIEDMNMNEVIERWNDSSRMHWSENIQ